MPKKYITVQVEVEFYEDTTQSALPDSIEAHTFSSEELSAVHDHLLSDHDADYDFMWDLRALIGNKANNE
jgi:hypothetical protein